MMNGLLDRLRSARHVELFALLALAALLALILLGGGGDIGEGGRTELEARLERILSGIDGAGRVSVMVAQDKDGRVSGAVVVAPELEETRTYLSMQSAVAKLLELEPAQIEIIGKDDRFGGAL